ncbi:Dihydroneopterin aldolase [Aliarcobacter thereius]|uniref:dihydroneopterin aldolase n=2 Tax=Aliarcobacter thereius TaxID=544718 RepID=A0A1C0B9F5_9BACT|nr:dihydroneopterin aldolase [Aliarcobacter thereius]OCL88632.1 Dihydroneopterin aldolase [Aliarcobacter thereius]OCL92127.1 Dihydroneopterin aldolase [Aliarcobacter thereius]OCL94777.1 Dihydroneopterin aldolase [Aliarcobacter thereius LMG 24486]OCM00225.1 Dihydroneopterin aldolase [Aliarcobacter thereius]QBF15347.1 dihydroneopterin aldolase [Aliarcobacter thereius LMG 24486]
MKISIKKLTFKSIIGILDFEREKKQKVVVDLSFEYDFRNDEFINYAEVSKLIKTTMKNKKYYLLEDAIKDISSLLYEKYSIKNLKLKISKPDILKDCIVSLSL